MIKFEAPLMTYLERMLSLIQISRCVARCVSFERQDCGGRPFFSRGSTSKCNALPPGARHFFPRSGLVFTLYCLDGPFMHFPRAEQARGILELLESVTRKHPSRRDHCFSMLDMKGTAIISRGRATVPILQPFLMQRISALAITFIPV